MLVQPTMSEAPGPKRFHFVGGDLSLDFTNSVGGKRGLRTREHLNTYGDFVSWSKQAGLLNEGRSLQLLQLAERQKEEADKVLSRGVKLREAIYNIFSAAIRHQPPCSTDLGALNSELALGLNRLRVVPGAGGFGWSWEAQSLSLDEPLGPIARSAAELLTKEHALEHVCCCEGDTCGWLFIDSTKNHSRRWCDMRDCGNRAKVRRHRLKQRGAPPAQG